MTYAERLKAYNGARDDLRALEDARNRYDFTLTEIIQRHTWKEDHDQIESARAARDKAAEPIPGAKLRAAILRDNARRAFFEEILPAAVDILRKYERKPYGEKTQRRISDEIHEKTGFYCYISDNGMHSKIQFSAYNTGAPWTHDELNATFYHDRKNPDDTRRGLLDEKNRIDTTSADLLRAYNLREYVEDPEARAEEIRAAHEKALAAWETWDAAASEYNALIPTTTAREIDTRAGKPYPIIY